ncbi:MAG: glycosyltransferase family 2 protein [Rhodanobacteraceae bacterium]|nr:glycosyltransferase family 2 protein [Rhodanobacteraceae bacterium]MBL0042707.1 glycosyltransferase family 2 protein [Xanthomonadales bacterium]MBP6077912.1 glycosyltransferase family 2 protein [Xanthomonadales bacterium]
MNRLPLSAVVTTFDNAATLEACLASLAFADELLVLDSGSGDGSVEIARRHGARVLVEAFKGYGPQKQSAIDQAAHDWVVLLDADEALTAGAAEMVEAALHEPSATGFELPRRERMFWRWQHPWSKHNHHLRLFDRRVHRMNAHDPVHAAPDRRVGRVQRLDAMFVHEGEPDIHSKVQRIDRYSSGLAEVLAARRSPWRLKLRLLFYPPLVLLKQGVLKRQFMNGWAGWIASVSQAYYAFLKDAKALEVHAQRRNAGSLARRLAQQADGEEGDPERGRDQH